MPVDYSGTICFKQNLQKVMVELSYAPSFQAVQTFCGVAHTMTTADIYKATFTQNTDPQLFGSGGDLSDLSFAAHFKFLRSDPNAEPRYKTFRLPAPKLAIFEHIPGRGYRILESYGDTMAAAYSAVCGETLTFDSGWLVN